jgi:hypothetical protein
MKSILRLRDEVHHASVAAIAVAIALLAWLAIASAASATQRETVWLCKPGLAENPCEPGLDTTLLTHSGTRVIGVKHPKADPKPAIDCFYVYPTVSDQDRTNANRNIDPEERSIALYQAARYSQECRVFAPMYRQLTLKALFSGGVTEEARQIAYRSVLQAWRDYLQNHNHGRGVVVIGHSQGTFVLRELLKNEVDSNRSIRKRLISALLLGGSVEVKEGEDVGGDFQHIRACHDETQLHCVVAFSTYDEAPPDNAIFARTPDPDTEVLCTNPAALGGGWAPVNTVVPSEPFAPGTGIGLATHLVGFPEPDVSTPWWESDGAYLARCSSARDANVLRIMGTPNAPDLNPVPDASWGLHLTDANIALGNLSQLVREQEMAYLGRHG